MSCEPELLLDVGEPALAEALERHARRRHARPAATTSRTRRRRYRSRAGCRCDSRPGCPAPPASARSPPAAAPWARPAGASGRAWRPPAPPATSPAAWRSGRSRNSDWRVGWWAASAVRGGRERWRGNLVAMPLHCNMHGLWHLRAELPRLSGLGWRRWGRGWPAAEAGGRAGRPRPRRPERGDADGGRRPMGRGELAALLLARPERQNAINRAMWQALARHCDEFERDPALCVVVVRGGGGNVLRRSRHRRVRGSVRRRQTAHDYNELVQDALSASSGWASRPSPPSPATASAADAPSRRRATCASPRPMRDLASRRRGSALATALATSGG